MKRMKKIICFLLMFCLCFVASTPAGVMAAEAEKLEVKFDNYAFTFPTINGGTVSTTAEASKEVTMLVCGATTCGMTGLTLKGIAESGWGHSEKLKVIYVDINGADADAVREFAKKWGSSKMTFCYDPDQKNFSSILKYMMSGGHLQGEILMPITVLIDGNDEVQCIYTQYRTADVLYDTIREFSSVSPDDPEGNDVTSGWDNVGNNDDTQNPADENVERMLLVGGQNDYDAANQVLEEVNRTRAAVGASALQMDQSLMETAMRRAAEISLYYSHTRPNGESCFSIFRNSGAKGENIAVGFATVQQVMQGWNGSPGHYANIIDTRYSSIGVGCFADSSGTRYWVQCFDNAAAAAPGTTGISAAQYTVSIRQSFLSLQTKGSCEIGCGSTQSELYMDVHNANTQFAGSRPELLPENFDFTSSNPDVAEVGENGIITVKSVGTAVITAALKQNPAYKVSRTVTKAAHVYRDTIVAPTDSSQGYTLHTCTICNDSYQDNYTSILPLPGGSTETGTAGSETAGNRPDNSETTGNQPNNSEAAGNQPGNNSETTGNQPNNSETIENRPGNSGTTGSETTENRPDGGQDFDIRTIQMQLSDTSVTYNGREQRPAVTITDGKGHILGSENYTVSYRNNINVGQASVTVQFHGSYAGGLSRTFMILPKGTTVSKLSANKKGFTVKWKKQSAQTNGYEIQYATNSRFKNSGTGTVTVKKSGKTSAKVKSLKAKKKYYVRIRTYKTVTINGVTTKLYSGWSKSKSIKTK